MTSPRDLVLQQVSVHCTNIVTLATHAEEADQYDDIVRELSAIETLDDRSFGPPLLFQACLLWCDLSREVDPPHRCDNPEHVHVSGFTMRDAVTGAPQDIDEAPPQLRWASRFLWAAREQDHETVMALWKSIPDSQAFTKSLVQLAVLVGLMVRNNVHNLDLGGG